MSTVTVPVLHSEWIKIRSLRACVGSLLAVLLVTCAITLLVAGSVGEAEAAEPGADLLLGAFFGINFGQVAAVAFGATAFAAEFHNGALRVSLSAVPDRTRFYLAKTTVIAAAALGTGTVTGFAAFLGGQALMGDHALALDDPGALRAVFGSGLYLMLMALLAAGLTALLRSGAAVLGLLIPFLLILPFVIGEVAGGAAQYLPDRAGQVVLHQTPPGSLGPWTGLGVTALWALTALLAGWVAVRCRDA
ncbi:ABC transporter permease subunit [Streptomyces sp. NPDC097619]|uniref:ABC transporter permease subunit n=1 Tax=Streptomyces sp. NPDC097619 TaxID=3157228 RepID=UPI00331D2F95